MQKLLWGKFAIIKGNTWYDTVMNEHQPFWGWLVARYFSYNLDCEMLVNRVIFRENCFEQVYVRIRKPWHLLYLELIKSLLYLGPVATFRCTVWLGAAWVAGRRRRARDFVAKSWNKAYSMRRFPFMNNNDCQICFILLPNLLVWIEIINIQKLVTHVTHCLSGE